MADDLLIGSKIKPNLYHIWQVFPAFRVNSGSDSDLGHPCSFRPSAIVPVEWTGREGGQMR